MSNTPFAIKSSQAALTFCILETLSGYFGEQ